MHFLGCVGPGGVVAGEAVHLLLGGKVEALLCPFVTDVAAGAVGSVRRDRDQCAVQDIFFTEQLPRLLVWKLPFPVGGDMHLLGGQVVAAEAGLGQLLAGCEPLLQDLKSGVIGGRLLLRCGRLRLCRLPGSMGGKARKQTYG